MPIELLLDGVDVTNNVDGSAGALSYDDELNTRTTLSLAVVDDEDALTITPGESIVLRDVGEPQALLTSDGEAILTSDDEAIEAPDVDVIFGGTVERTSESVLGPVRQWTVEAVSFDQIADRHTIAKVYENTLAGDIVRDLVTLKLADDGVHIDGIEDGPVLEYVLFNYISVADALNKVSGLADMPWWIAIESGDRRVMHFQSRETATAPFTLTDADVDVASNLQIVRSRERYRNRQIIRAGRDLTDPREENFVGDGERRTFNVAFPVGMAPTVEVDTGSGYEVKTVGIRGLETGFDWYWNKDTTEISQDDDADPLEATDALAVTYRGLFPVVVIVQDDLEIATRQGIEGGSGRYERVNDEQDIDSVSVAVETALAYLDRDGRIPTTITFETLEPGVRAGQLLIVNRTNEAIVGDFLITSVRAAYFVGDIFKRVVTAVDGGHLGGWVSYFHNLAASRRAAAAKEEESLITVRASAVPVLCGVALDVDIAAPESRIGIMQIGIGEIGANL